MKKTMRKMLCAIVFALTLCSFTAMAEEAVQGIMDKILVVYNMNQKTKDNTTYYPLHVYAGIDSLAYQEVGFEMRAESTDLKAEKSNSTRVVYQSMNVTDHNGEVTKYAASDLGGAYMFGHEMLFTAGKWYNKDTTVYVTPYAIRKDGTKITGKELTLSDAIIKQKNPASALFKEVDVEVEDPEETPDVEIGNLIASGSTAVTPSEDGKVTGDGVLIDATDASAEVPAGVSLEEGTTELTLSVAALDESASDVQTGDTEELAAFDVNVSGVSKENDVPILVTVDGMAKNGLNNGNIKVYHVEADGTKEMTRVSSVAELNAHNQFAYDATEGTLTMSMASFSEVSVVSDTVNAWNGKTEAFSKGTGTENDPYIIANADQLAYLGEVISNTNESYGNKHYKLNADINFGGENNSHVFYPIGYHKLGSGANAAGETTWYTYGGAFMGVFDGAGHTVSGIYQRTWDMDGDYDKGYWNDAMGLFGYVFDGTIKNLTIDNFFSEGEFAPTGCVAAYAGGNATFENISVINSHPQTYNTGVAGIVGWDDGGDEADLSDQSNLVFRNITIDSSNTISALWGSWDVAAAGILGYLGEYSKATMENCHVAATIDIYNDVCGNYQYYWHRYCGMMIGTVDKTREDGSLDLSNIKATNCTADFGDRHENFYCEFVKNSLASYTHDHQFSRVPHSDLNFDDKNGNGRVDVDEVASVTGCKHDHESAGYETTDIDKDGVIDSNVLKEDKQAIHIPFRQLFGGYGWGVDGVDLNEYKDENGKQYIQISTIATSVEKFESTGKTEFVNGESIIIGKIFDEYVANTENNAIDVDNVQVFVTPVGETSTASAVYTPNTTDWKEGKLLFSGTGTATISITDYKYCKTTTINVTVAEPNGIWGYEWNYNLEKGWEEPSYGVPSANGETAVTAVVPNNNTTYNTKSVPNKDGSGRLITGAITKNISPETHDKAYAPRGNQFYVYDINKNVKETGYSSVWVSTDFMVPRDEVGGYILAPHVNYYNHSLAFHIDLEGNMQMHNINKNSTTESIDFGKVNYGEWYNLMIKYTFYNRNSADGGVRADVYLNGEQVATQSECYNRYDIYWISSTQAEDKKEIINNGAVCFYNDIIAKTRVEYRDDNERRSHHLDEGIVFDNTYIGVDTSRLPYPIEGDTLIARAYSVDRTKIGIRFTKDKADLTAADVQVQDVNGNLVASGTGTIEWVGNNREAVVELDKKLAPYTDYEVVVNGITDAKLFRTKLEAVWEFEDVADVENFTINPRNSHTRFVIQTDTDNADNKVLGVWFGGQTPSGSGVVRRESAMACIIGGNTISDFSGTIEVSARVKLTNRDAIAGFVFGGKTYENLKEAVSIRHTVDENNEPISKLYFRDTDLGCKVELNKWHTLSVVLTEFSSGLTAIEEIRFDDKTYLNNENPHFIGDNKLCRIMLLGDPIITETNKTSQRVYYDDIRIASDTDWANWLDANHRFSNQ